MKKIAAIAFAAILASLANANADQPGPDWMLAQPVIEKVLKSGYTQVTQLEADDGRWEGEGIKNGQKMDFHADRNWQNHLRKIGSLAVKRPP